MYQIVHGMAGIAIGSRLDNPILAFVLGIVSHFVLDAIPHDSLELRDWENNGTDKFIKKIALEAILDLWGLMLGILMMQEGFSLYLNYPMMAGMIGAISPDYIWGLTELSQTKNQAMEKFKAWHNKIHTIIYKAVYLPLKYTVPIQVIALTALVILIKK
ncbi:hypothetical protein A3H03_03225 [Candidatus Kuenenbacteria bacterium RIFCSPLOWO2_12_FULL_42_13]|uniref:Uncharacterized protein n=5 Tax=Candidatus Kueneniibacteriota TaxID=1752740 RepID=A0A0G0Z476_9BACT|nr:MAG: hypothetical protein UV02_C0001G0007 [Candidatus Kuenenbacteria bacterium GW2011_GWA2_42_15]OGG89508.1 MAG: hypothetical protein A3C68_01550 [Candidatus Kuenenbacteria bacterium RIFCSPHIGHO2_02_FULL_42_29]OGG90867.1 MAG: hypothetical protein A3H55_00690 [Candidatus Kuenenbacteria bacterium RIFCSPLOWO2_02_FULL_42_16]OGG91567.1 MAG: hypothetical protein A3H03_03225 [Candidatus Kuenenbacteria bacterium RIFCSPLOWO2_12_FULL_42_13]OGG95816.1 MAG: hypothetical protein A2V95_03095 [Candidatus K